MRNSQELYLFNSLISLADIVKDKFYQIAPNKLIKKIGVKVSTNFPGVEYTHRKIAFEKGVGASSPIAF